MLRTTDWEVCLPLRRASTSYRRLDALLAEFPERIQTHKCDIELSEEVFRIVPHPDYIVHLAASTSIADSIASPVPYIYNNVGGTMQMLEYARAIPQLKRFLYFSTDEVFGPSFGPDGFHEWSRYYSHSPYAASKAASEELCLAWARTYGIPVIITHAQNLIGERQSAEKFLPTVVRAALTDQKVNIYTDEKTHRQSMRNYLHARDAASAVLFLLQCNIEFPQKYNIATEREYSNLGILQIVGRILSKNIKWQEIDAGTVRPGFFVDHGLNCHRICALGWQPIKTLAENLTDVVHWMIEPENKHWIGL